MGLPTTTIAFDVASVASIDEDAGADSVPIASEGVSMLLLLLLLLLLLIGRCAASGLAVMALSCPAQSRKDVTCRRTSSKQL